MLYHVAIHRPKPEHEQDLIDSMHRFGAAARGQGAIEAHTFKDDGPTRSSVSRSGGRRTTSPRRGPCWRPPPSTTTSTRGRAARSSCSCSTTSEMNDAPEQGPSS